MDNLLIDLDNLLDEAIDFPKLKVYFQALQADAQDTLGTDYSLDDCIETLTEYIKEEIEL